MNLTEIAITLAITSVLASTTVTAGASILDKVKNEMPVNGIYRALEDFEPGSEIDIENLLKGVPCE